MTNKNIKSTSNKSPLGKRSSPTVSLANHPGNHYKFCPRCATEGSFDRNNYAFKCHACGFHFFLNSSTAVTALIFNDKGEILLTRRGVEPSIGMLDLPGGFIDPGESAEEALFREVKEELNLVPEKIEYFGSYPNEYAFSGTIVFTTDIVFKCTVNDFSQLKFRDDIIGLEFKKPLEIDFDEVPFLSVQNILKRIQHEE